MTTEPRPARPWPLLLLAAPAFVAIWSGWVGLGERTGFGVVQPFPGIAYLDGIHLNTAITLPIGVETYAAYALRVWLAGAANDRAREFARWSAIVSLVLGGLGQVAYHLMVAAGIEHAHWGITTLVSCLPVAVLGMGVALAHLQNAPEQDTPQTSAPAVQQTAVGAEPLPLPEVVQLVEHAGRAAAAAERPAVVSATVPEAIEAPKPERPRKPQKPGSTRQKVADHLAQNPKSTATEIAEVVGVSRQTVDYHLTALRKETQDQ